MLKALYNAIRGDAAPTVIEIKGRNYTSKNVVPVSTPTPAKLTVSTLTGLVDYIKSNVDELNVSSLLCHVESPSKVTLNSNLLGDFADRAAFLAAELHQLQIPLNKYLDAEAFNILLQSCFVEPEDSMQGTDRGLVLKYVSNVKKTLEAGYEDDGVSQGVTVKKGISGSENVVLPNPVTLRPYRTFVEVEQPASKFVFRARDDDGMQFMLVEADGGAWRGEAMKNIKAFLETAVPGLNVIA
ncbi:MAG: hypothetical protein RBR41_03240 [Desulfovibrio sp.]|uniref:hypothetical protein n=1 Tax=Desulfovibrio sp. TaxID=885 RepID=UPI002A35AB0A|nr:hypothetical protein [Desulfovibrio sp.]MDY0258666.1 hypothetical protein [Desulfovibrio sp.]